MPVTLIATPGAIDANTYPTLAEANAYFKARLPLSGTQWEDVDDQTAALAMATRVMDTFAEARRVFIPASGGIAAHYITSRKWNGTPTTALQRLAFPRTGLKDRNGNDISPDVIPEDLKNATAELAGLLATADTTQENEVEAAGITAIKAGSVSLTFRDAIARRILPQSVLLLLPASWLTDEEWEDAAGSNSACFEVI